MDEFKKHGLFFGKDVTKITKFIKEEIQKKEEKKEKRKKKNNKTDEVTKNIKIQDAGAGKIEAICSSMDEKNCFIKIELFVRKRH